MGIMASEAYSISSPAGESVEGTLCSCQRFDVGNSRKMIVKTSSLSSTSSTAPSFSILSRRNRSFSSPMLIALIVMLSYLTCCVSAWPRRSFNYAPVQMPVLQRQNPPPSVVLPSDYDLDTNQWAMAAQPVGMMPDAYYDELPNLPLQQDMYDDDQLYEDPEEPYQIPYFGPIIPEEPEEELELEELKHEQPFRYEKRRSGKVMNTKKPAVTVPTTPATTAASLMAKSSSSSTTVVAPSFPKKQVRIGALNPGQKEIAMLRPPSPKSHQFQAVEPEEPKISVAQRSPSNEKPSAYDRLRKYLSLDDALKKEYQQRRASAVSRHTKRESISSIITDSDSLTGQLNSLKKSMD